MSDIKELHWGILGAGFISSWFVHDLVRNNSMKTNYKHIIEAIGCSTQSKGTGFINDNKIIAADNYGVTPIVESYDDFFANPKINVVYIGTPHPLHKEQVTKLLQHGKNVLCEKPFTINAKDAKQLQALAKEKNLFLMEGVWTRFFPTIKKLEKLLFQDKMLGDIKRMIMDFSFDGVKLPPDHRMRDNKLGGGALVDIGMYCMTYGRILMDPNVAPNNMKFDVKSFEAIDPGDKVDYVSSWILNYANGAQAVLSCSLHNDMIPGFPYLLLQGTKGSVQIYGENPARPETIKIYLKDGETIVLKEDMSYKGFIYEANAVADDIALGKISNDVVPFEETLLVMETLDSIRRESGLRYEQDDE